MSVSIDDKQYWINAEEWLFQQKWMAMNEYLYWQRIFYGVEITEELRKQAHEKFGVPYTEPTPTRLGHFIMTHDRGMLWLEDGKVYERTDYQEAATEPSENQGYKYWRGVTGFDF